MAISAVGADKAIKGKGSTGSKYPVPEPTKANNGLIYKSNSKHTLGGEGNRPNAGIEPKNSLELFGNSYQSGKKRYAADSQGIYINLLTKVVVLKHGIGLDELEKISLYNKDQMGD